MTQWPTILALACLSPGMARAAQDPLATKTMTVYVTNSADSVAVKDHYIQARYNVPSTAPVCPITLPDPLAPRLEETVYLNSVKTPIRNCLNTYLDSGGKKRILYIVLAYVRPFGIDLPRGMGYYAMDSYLADIWDQYSTQEFNPVPTANHRYYADSQNFGNVYVPFQSLEANRAQPRSLLNYSVWRLDGSTPDIAKALVDKATAAMNNATGAACIDRNRGDIRFVPDHSYGIGDWDLYKAGVFLRNAGIQVTEDANFEEYGTAPASPKCPADGSPVAFYSGWYSFNNYNGAPVFNWAPGAVGFHLDSASALDPRTGSNWSANAVANGITVTSGAVAEPYLEGLPRPAGVFRNLLEGANVGDAFLRNTRWLKWRVLNIGDPLYRPFPASGKSPFNPPPPENSFAIATRDISGGQPTTGTITLAAAAPAGGVNVALSSSAPAFVNVPPSVTVAANSTSATFPITTSVTPSIESATLTATTASAVIKNSMRVYPLLSGVALSQSTVSAGISISASVFLNASAPPGGITITLSSTDPTVATVPATVFVPAGLGRASFVVNTSIAAASKATTIHAIYNGTDVETDLTAVPAIRSVSVAPTSTTTQGTFVVVEIYLSVAAPPGGATVNLTSSNPTVAPLAVSSIFIPAGTTYGNSGFNAGPGPATATIQAAYGGDTKSVTLTVN